MGVGMTRTGARPGLTPTCRCAVAAAVVPTGQRDKEGSRSGVGKGEDTRARCLYSFPPFQLRLPPSSLSRGRWVRPASARSLAGRKKIRRCHWPAVCPGGHGGLKHRPHFRIYFLGPTRTVLTYFEICTTGFCIPRDWPNIKFFVLGTHYLFLYWVYIIYFSIGHWSYDFCWPFTVLPLSTSTDSFQLLRKTQEEGEDAGGGGNRVGCGVGRQGTQGRERDCPCVVVACPDVRHELGFWFRAREGRGSALAPCCTMASSPSS